MTDDQQHDGEQKFMRRIRTFVRRPGRMTEGQQWAYDNLWAEYGHNIADGALDFAEFFGRQAPVVLEIGFGMGDSLLDMAQNAPETDFLGIEVHTPGVGRILNNMHQAGITNLRVMQEDAIEVLEKCIPDASLDRLQLYFPDPWHKKKHNKRRMVQPEWVQRVHNKLKVGGVLHMATDWEPYAEHMVEVMGEFTDQFSNQASRPPYSSRPEWRPETKFERRGMRKGHGVWDLLYEKSE